VSSSIICQFGHFLSPITLCMPPPYKPKDIYFTMDRSIKIIKGEVFLFSNKQSYIVSKKDRYAFLKPFENTIP